METIMRAANDLENKGLLIRESPRKLLVAPSDAECGDDTNVGMIGFSGEVFSDFERALRHRLYERKIFTSTLEPPAMKNEAERYFQRFFLNRYAALFVRDDKIAEPGQVEKHAEKFEKVIFVFEKRSKKWTLPSKSILLDYDHMLFQSLKEFYLKGYRRVVLFTPGPPQNILRPEREKRNGALRFFDEFNLQPDSDSFHLEVADSHKLHRDPTAQRKWASELHPETDAIIGSSDFVIVSALGWVKNHSSVNHERLVCLGRGNTNWSKIGPTPFASFDYRIKDFVTASLNAMDDETNSPITKHLRPKLKREELIPVKTY
jgi:DNA-binding LacI/PurR family transcriptional regulator